MEGMAVGTHGEGKQRRVLAFPEIRASQSGRGLIQFVHEIRVRPLPPQRRRIQLVAGTMAELRNE